MFLLEDAPQKGTIYATFIDKVIFDRYESLEDIQEHFHTDGLLELHLFDDSKELRFVKTRDKGIQRYLVPGCETYDDEYEEALYVSGENIDKQDNLSQKIKVVNYIRYDENDMLHIVNYRLKEV